MNAIKKYLFTVVLFLLACTNPEPSFILLPEDVQTVSQLGDTLFTKPVEIPENISSRIDSLINVAEAGQDDQITIMIWQARKKGYQGEYRDAVQLLSAAIEEYPNEPRLYRHRGHRYITLRAFDHAIADFEKAVELIRETEDIVEPDGLPNARNFPTSSLHTNIWYHLGLAYYLKGDYKNAQLAYQRCMLASTNDDMMVAALYWYYMTLKRAGKDELAGKVIQPVTPGMDIIENNSYHKLLLVFNGTFEPEMLLEGDESDLDNATIGYGLGNWHYINDRKNRARSIWQQVYDAGNWAAFGFIASETELANH